MLKHKTLIRPRSPCFWQPTNNFLGDRFSHFMYRLRYSIRLSEYLLLFRALLKGGYISSSKIHDGLVVITKKSLDRRLLSQYRNHLPLQRGQVLSFVTKKCLYIWARIHGNKMLNHVCEIYLLVKALIFLVSSHKKFEHRPLHSVIAPNPKHLFIIFANTASVAVQIEVSVPFSSKTKTLEVCFKTLLRTTELHTEIIAKGF